MITHDVTQALAADRVLWLEQGRIVEDGPPGLLMGLSDSRVRAWVLQAGRDGRGGLAADAAARA